MGSGQGQTAILSYALAYPKWDTVLEPRSVVLLTKQLGIIDSTAQVLHGLRSADFRLDDKTIRDTLELTVEKNGKEVTRHCF